MLLLELAKEVSFGLMIWVSAFIGMKRRIHQGWQEQKDVLFALPPASVCSKQVSIYNMSWWWLWEMRWLKPFRALVSLILSWIFNPVTETGAVPCGWPLALSREKCNRLSADVQSYPMWWSGPQQGFQSSLTADSPLQTSTKPRQMLPQSASTPRVCPHVKPSAGCGAGMRHG